MHLISMKNRIIEQGTRRILNKCFEEKKTDRIYQIIVHDKKKNWNGTVIISNNQNERANSWSG